MTTKNMIANCKHRFEHVRENLDIENRYIIVWECKKCAVLMIQELQGYRDRGK